MRLHFIRLAALLSLTAALLLVAPSAVDADEGWTIRSFDVTYEVTPDGLVHVTEDIIVDFGGLQRRGIFRDMPIRYDYPGEYDRLISPANVYVDNGATPWRYELIWSDNILQIKIGDPNIFISGEQRYRISYLLTGALNALDDHDEFFWNVTGDQWPVPIESASATVRAPGGIAQVACFRGPSGSTETCDAQFTPGSASFAATRTLPSGSGMTIVTGIEKGVVDVGEPVLVEPVKNELEQIRDAFEFSPLTAGASVFLFVGGLGIALRQWWMRGRDRWYGEVWYVNDGQNDLGRRKPLFAREAVLTEYEPPPIGKEKRPMRPGEIGVLLDESADTLDVTATIVDLAVRGHLRITEIESGGVLGLFKSKDYELQKLSDDDSDLLPYESRTKSGIFGRKDVVKMSELKNKFYKTLEKVKDALYDQMVKKDQLFPRSPDSSRLVYRIAGGVIAAIGVGAGVLLAGLGWSLMAVPVVLVGIIVFLMAPLMPSRTARGRALYQRALGFRRFMVTAETERQRFAERANIFHEYLPYAIVYKCVDKWAKAFEGLADRIDEPGWYVGTHPFAARSFADSFDGFSSSISDTIASTPGGSGGSGFSGGGSSGGGGGGGGGGSW